MQKKFTVHFSRKVREICGKR